MGIRVFPGAQDVLVAGVVGTLVQHPAATLHLNGVAAAEVRVQVRAVSVALIALALEILVLEEHNLHGKKQTNPGKLSFQQCNKYNNKLSLCLNTIKMTTN